jgi:hypothetical protein
MNSRNPLFGLVFSEARALYPGYARCQGSPGEPEPGQDFFTLAKEQNDPINHLTFIDGERLIGAWGE